MKQITGFCSLALLTCAFALAGCQKSEDNRSGAKSEPPVKIVSFSDLGLTGRWKSGCAKTESGNSNQLRFDLQGNSMVRTWEFFSGADCLATQRVFVKESTFKDPSETVSALAGWQQIQLEVVSITAMPIIAEEAEALNQEKAYGFSNWVPNEKKLITGLKSGEDSSAESEAGKIWEMTLKREGSNLRFARYVNDKAEPADEPDWKFTLE